MAIKKEHKWVLKGAYEKGKTENNPDACYLRLEKAEDKDADREYYWLFFVDNEGRSIPGGKILKLVIDYNGKLFCKLVKIENKLLPLDLDENGYIKIQN